MIHEQHVPDEATGIRLDVWLEGGIEGCTRSRLAMAIKDGRCTVTPGKAKPGYRLRGGETVIIDVPEVEPSEAVPEDLPLTILYEDAHLVVVDKAPGMVVHPAVGHLHGTLVNALLGRYGTTLPGGEAWRPGIIHRLDAGTSGVIAVAKTPESLAFYQDCFRERSVKKRYLVLVAGHPRADFLEHRGAIGKHPKDFRKRMVVDDDARSARSAYTSFLVRDRREHHAVVEARPRTGRTHQIRVHLADLGHPVLADGLYGRSDRWPPTGQELLTRTALHAWELRLLGMDGGDLVFRAPVPADLTPLVSAGIEPLDDEV